MGHMGVPRTVPPVPCGTVGRDRHFMYDGTHGTVPSVRPVPLSHMGQEGQAMYDGTHGSL